MKCAVIVAGGSSTRFGNDKLNMPLFDKTVLQNTVDVFRPIVDQIVVVGAHVDGTTYAEGGQTRFCRYKTGSKWWTKTANLLPSTMVQDLLQAKIWLPSCLTRRKQMALQSQVCLLPTQFGMFQPKRLPTATISKRYKRHKCLILQKLWRLLAERLIKTTPTKAPCFTMFLAS